MILHVLVYLPRVLRDGLADWQRRRLLGGAGLRRGSSSGAWSRAQPSRSAAIRCRAPGFRTATITGSS
jgi:hypothetical protein